MPKLRIAKPSLQKLTEEGEALLRGARGQNLAATIRALNPVLRGWAAHFKLAETKRALKDCDGWIQHKLRCVLWRQWKRSYVRARNLMHRGLTEERAWRSATTTGTARGGTLARVTCTRCSRSLGSTAWG